MRLTCGMAGISPPGGDTKQGTGLIPVVMGGHPTTGSTQGCGLRTSCGKDNLIENSVECMSGAMESSGDKIKRLNQHQVREH